MTDVFIIMIIIIIMNIIVNFFPVEFTAFVRFFCIKGGIFEALLYLDGIWSSCVIIEDFDRYHRARRLVWLGQKKKKKPFGIFNQFGTLNPVSKVIYNIIFRFVLPAPWGDREEAYISVSWFFHATPRLLQAAMCRQE